MRLQGVFYLKQLASKQVPLRCVWTEPMRISRRVLRRGTCTLRVFVPPQSNAMYQGDYDKELYKKRKDRTFLTQVKSFQSYFHSVWQAWYHFFGFYCFRDYYYTFTLCERALVPFLSQLNHCICLFCRCQLISFVKFTNLWLFLYHI